MSAKWQRRTDLAVPLQMIRKPRCSYKSATIAKLKGLHNDGIEDALGYADSNYITHPEVIAHYRHVSRRLDFIKNVDGLFLRLL
ncbi:LANO_0H15214g1_1 [Lachancea nothofagi CBS 11611]|uniref:LANO_0H15214g1_1 n=1 Tax=Lachancea nothofagi CBS 11611 TaxID=1266666 RepID=A0A1G4KMX2_9SACH|nr:LANO_0H15214g1_1 [Lachancea nothofagi CBS 11611]